MQFILTLRTFEGMAIVHFQDDFANLISSVYDFLEVIVHG